MGGLLGELDGEEVIVDPATDPRDIYKLMVGAIVPRPIAFVSTLSAAGCETWRRSASSPR